MSNSGEAFLGKGCVTPSNTLKPISMGKFCTEDLQKQE